MAEKYEEKIDTASRTGGQGHASGGRHANNWKSDATSRPGRCDVAQPARWKTAVKEMIVNVGTMRWPDQEKIECEERCVLASPFDFVPGLIRLRLNHYTKFMYKIFILCLFD